MIDVVCGVIWNEEGLVLACRRAADRHLGGLWEFPGGKVEEGEEPRMGLARELREELGVEVEVGEGLATVEWDYGGRPIRLLPFHCRLVSGVAAALDHEEIRWCGREELRKLEWAGADLPVLAEIFGETPG